jgi:Dolichyl-phosphate-mannose-protein mannosyltransferase
MATDASARSSRARASPSPRLAVPRWPAPAWGAIGVTALFIVTTSWWLSQDHSIPIFDAGLHLSIAINVHHELAAGHLLKALTLSIPYPPFVYLVGSLGIAIGGVGIAPLVITENLVFVSLLSLGCYKVARLAFGPPAGLLAVIFALGSPLVAAQFRVFMTDAPETAMVAVSVWLILATKGFSELKSCALAGLAVGVGMLTKEPLPIFVVGIVGVALYRGGRESWRGFLLFAVVAFVIAGPWYLHELGQLQNLGSEASDSSNVFTGYPIPDVAPARLSIDNLTWYLWSMINTQLYLPLLTFAAVGWVWTLVGFARRRIVSPLALELVVGAFLSWALITETFIHDTRYSLPLTVYLAVFGAGWIVRLPRRWLPIAASVLVFVAVANNLGIIFGSGRTLQVTVAGAKTNTLEQAGVFTFYEDHGFLVSAPRRDGDLLAMFRALKANGVRTVSWPFYEAREPDFSTGGVHALSQIAGLDNLESEYPPNLLTQRNATLAHVKIGPGLEHPCVRLDDGTGIWVRLGNPFRPGVKDYCPLPKPHFYS